MDDNSTRIAAADWESPHWWSVSFPDGRLVNFTKEEFLQGVHFDDTFDVLVVESPHLKERNGYSVAQVYTTEELESWQPQTKVVLSPGKLAWRIRQYVDGDKTRDAEGLRLFMEDNPATFNSLKRWRRPSEIDTSSWAWRDALREDIRKQINILRVQWKGMSDLEMDQLPQVKHCRELVDAIYDDLPEAVREQFNLRRGLVGAQKGKLRFSSPTQAFTIYSCIYDMDGNLRTNPNTGRFYGVNAALYGIIGLSHSSMPNAARANLIHFGLRPKLRKAAEEDHQQVKADWLRNVRLFTQALRDEAHRREGIVLESLTQQRLQHTQLWAIEFITTDFGALL